MRSSVVEATCLLCLLSSTARAGNDDELFVGDEAAVTSGAVTATVSDGSSLYYNPAGLMEVSDDTIDILANAYGLRLYRAPELLSATDGTISDSSFSEIVVVPTLVAYTRPINDRLRWGIGLFQTRATNLSLRSQLSLPQDDDRTLAWEFSLEDDTEAYHGALGIAWQPSRRFRLGATLSLYYESTEGSILLSGGVFDEAGVSDSLSSTSFVVHGMALGVRAGLGMQWMPHESVVIGLAAFSPVLNVVSTADVTFVEQGVSQGTTTFVTGSGDSTDGVSMGLPARIRLGLAIRGDWGWAALDGDYQHGIGEALGDSRAAVWNLRGGALFRVKPLMRLGFGLFTDRGPAQRPDAFGSGSIDLYGGTVGAQFGKERHLDPAREEDSHIVFNTTVAVRYAYGRSEMGGLVVPATPPVDEGITVRPVDIITHELSLHLGTSVQF